MWQREVSYIVFQIITDWVMLDKTSKSHIHLRIDYLDVLDIPSEYSRW